MSTPPHPQDLEMREQIARVIRAHVIIMPKPFDNKHEDSADRAASAILSLIAAREDGDRGSSQSQPVLTPKGAIGEAEEPPAFVPCEFYMTWTKTGRLPRFTSHDLDHAKREANRLARNNPGHTFVVMRGVEKIRYGEDLDGEPHKHPDSIAKRELLEALQPFVLALVEARIAASRAGLSVAAMTALARASVDFADFRMAEIAYRALSSESPPPQSEAEPSAGTPAPDEPKAAPPKPLSEGEAE